MNDVDTRAVSDTVCRSCGSDQKVSGTHLCEGCGGREVEGRLRCALDLHDPDDANGRVCRRCRAEFQMSDRDVKALKHELLNLHKVTCERERKSPLEKCERCTKTRETLAGVSRW